MTTRYTRGVWSLQNVELKKPDDDWVALPRVFVNDSNTHGYYAGGASPGYPGGAVITPPNPGPSATSIVSKLAYSSETVARQPSADLPSQKVLDCGTTSSSNAGYMIGGMHNNGRSTKIVKLTYASDTTAEISSTIGPSWGWQAMATFNDVDTKVYATAGKSGPAQDPVGGTNLTVKMPFGTETWATIPTLGTAIGNTGQALSSSTSGYVAGGRNDFTPGPTGFLRSFVQKFNFSTDANSRAPSMDLTYAVKCMAAAGDSTTGYIMGGGTNQTNYTTLTSNINKFTYATETASLNPSKLPRATLKGDATGNKTAGYSAGGKWPGDNGQSSFAKINFNTGTTSTVSSQNLVQGERLVVSAFSPVQNVIPEPKVRWFDDAAAGTFAVTFDGSNDYLSLGSSSDFDIGTGDFTFECWVYADALTTGGHYKRVWEMGSSTSNSIGIDIQPEGVCNFRINDSVIVNTGSGVISTGVWTHIAVCRKGGTITLYINGTTNNGGTASASNSTDIDHSSNTFRIGANHAQPSNSSWNGEISNFRYVKGTAVYTSNFTVPTESLGNITNTKLLCCNQSTTTGATVKPGTITANGGVTAGSHTSIPINSPPPATPTPNTSDVPGPTPNTGYYGGGTAYPAHPPTYRSLFDKIEYSTNTTTALPSTTAFPGNTPTPLACGTGLNAYFSNGNLLYKMPYSTQVLGSIPNLARNHNGGGAFSNSEQGCWAMGSAFGPGYAMSSVTFATDTPTTVPNWGMSGQDGSNGTGNQTAGYLGGDRPNSRTVCKFIYATSTSQSLGNKLSEGRCTAAATGNSTQGYFTGCGNNAPGTRTDKITYSNDTSTYVPGANATRPFIWGSASSSLTGGYITGGYTNPSDMRSDMILLTYSNDTMSALPSGAQMTRNGMKGACGISARMFGLGATMQVPTPNVI